MTVLSKSNIIIQLSTSTRIGPSGSSAFRLPNIAHRTMKNGEGGLFCVAILQINVDWKLISKYKVPNSIGLHDLAVIIANLCHKPSTYTLLDPSFLRLAAQIMAPFIRRVL